ncbi:MAG: helix-turn-helix transcriptional regulator [Oscillospiraceae bacterium]|nr:helix-turn-helix transcriptional regulator [Oscillospiraceae bacterium]MBQ8917991.1 helix-turn-helix transcriptional regulator [Oscillospiraceae bacterium]MBQ9109291.1 helix-turn-helix transcriptional regulator [Oscillospiraceae bacterium]
MADCEALIKNYLPMTEQGFLLLNSLCQERHGYGIMQHVHELTDGRINLGSGTVYTMLYKMENDGLIHTVREEDRRKIYHITKEGRIVLQAEAKRLCQLAEIAAQI